MKNSSECEWPLPQDMVFEILARTALRTMDRCQVVSKEWKELIQSDPSFMASYSKTTGNLIGYMVQSIVACKYLHEFVSPYNHLVSENFIVNDDFHPFKFGKDVKIEASSPQGILCCFRMMGTQCRYYITKPCTNQWQALPNPKSPHSSYTQKLALVVMSTCTSTTPSLLRYKIFRISRPRFSSLLDVDEYRCQIFDSNTWAWKRSEDVILSRENRFENSPAVYASGLVSFLTKDYVLAFCPHQETPLTISLPENNNNLQPYQCKRIIDYQGKLGLIYCTSGSSNNDNIVELWVLKKDWKNADAAAAAGSSCGSTSTWWEMIKRLNIDNVAKQTCYPSAAGFFNTETALMRTLFGLLFLDLKDFSFNEIRLQHHMYADDVLPFRSDWEQVKLRDNNFSMPSKKNRCLKKPTSCRINNMSEKNSQSR